jgi:hypothetical protein
MQLFCPQITPPHAPPPCSITATDGALRHAGLGLEGYVQATSPIRRCVPAGVVVWVGDAAWRGSGGVCVHVCARVACMGGPRHVECEWGGGAEMCTLVPWLQVWRPARALAAEGRPEGGSAPLHCTGAGRGAGGCWLGSARGVCGVGEGGGGSGGRRAVCGVVMVVVGGGGGGGGAANGCDCGCSDKGASKTFFPPLLTLPPEHLENQFSWPPRPPLLPSGGPSS